MHCRDRWGRGDKRTLGASTALRMDKHRTYNLRGALDFEDDRKNERALGGVLVDVAFEVDANLLFDDAPVGFFFGVRLFDGLEDDVAGSGHEFIAIVAEHA